MVKLWLRSALLIVCFYSSRVDGFAAWMVNEFCDRLVQPGSVIMNEVVVLSDERQVRLHRAFFTENGQQVVEEVGGTGSELTYYPGEELTVTVSDDQSGSLSTEYLFETSRGAARFLAEERGCRHTRTNVNSQILTMPQFKTEVKVWVGK